MNNLEILHDILTDHKLCGTQHDTLKGFISAEAEREKGCEHCNCGEPMAESTDCLRRDAYIYLDGNTLTADLYSESMCVAICFCPMCGRKLVENT